MKTKQRHTTKRRSGKPDNLPPVESTASFKARLAAILPRPTLEERREANPSIRQKGMPSGFYDAPKMNEDPTRKASEQNTTRQQTQHETPAHASAESANSGSVQLSTKQTIKLANKAFDALVSLNHIDWHNHREKLFDLCKAEEKDHRGFLPRFRESHTDDTANVNDAARMFAVKRLAEYMQGERQPVGKDYLHIQKSCFYAAGIVDEYRERVEKAWADFDVTELASLDYCQIVKVKFKAKRAYP